MHTFLGGSSTRPKVEGARAAYGLLRGVQGPFEAFILANLGCADQQLAANARYKDTTCSLRDSVRQRRMRVPI